MSEMLHTNPHEQREQKPLEEAQTLINMAHPRVIELRAPSSEHFSSDFHLGRRCNSPGLGAVVPSVLTEHPYVSARPCPSPYPTHI